MPVTAPLIKGFLPVRLQLSKDDETFFYVKEHQSGGKNNAYDAEGSTGNSNNNNSNKTKPGCTLFVVNAPIVPGVSTKLALRSLLGRYADVSRVTVIPNPRHNSRRRRGNDSSNHNKADESSLPLTVESLALWSDKVTLPTFLPPIYHEGKYAHVVFASPKGLKKTMQELHRVMSSSSSSSSDINNNAIQKKNKTKTKKKKTSTHQTSDSDDGDENDGCDEEEALPCLTMDRLEIQTLADETVAQYEREEHERRHGKGSLENGHDDDEDFEDYDEEGNPLSKKSKAKTKDTPTQGALAVIKRYRDSSQSLSRAELLAECNRVMGEYEEAEQAKRKAHQEAKDGNMVDDDGFVTVSYSSNNMAASGTTEGGIHNLLEESITTTTTSHSRRKVAPRRRNNVKKNNGGSSELQDFYRFQRKEYKKRTLDQLRTQFEDDLRKIKKMKEGHQYRPFGR
ncbi:MAG: hypothetical protein SGBAC_005454 [Bacillariaceae sp.]